MVSQLGRTQGPPLGRHVAAVGLTLVLMLFFWWLGDPSSDEYLPLSHAVLADTSLVLLCLILMLGAFARFVARLRPVVPWGRELGIAMFVTAGLHVAILNGLSLDVLRWVREETFNGSEWSTNMWAATNWVGALALGYALVLAATSNDWSQRKLRRGWKFLQRQAYTLFVLTWLHTAAFVLIGAGHGALLSAWLFLGVAAAAMLAQFAGFVHTVRAPRGPSPHRAPPKIDTGSSDAVSMRTARWLGVVALWSSVIVGSWALAHVPSLEERQLARLCERYAELGGLPMAEIREELMEVAPDDVGPGAPLSEWLLACGEDA